VSFARLVLRLSAVPFAGVGLAFLLFPAAMAAQVDISLASATADHDVRAVYGGLQLGCAALLLFAAARPERVRFGLVAQLALYGGLASARLLAWAWAGTPGPLGVALHAAEIAGIALGALAWRRLAATGREA
jgi:hypothetical protein